MQTRVFILLTINYVCKFINLYPYTNWLVVDYFSFYIKENSCNLANIESPTHAL